VTATAAAAPASILPVLNGHAQDVLVAAKAAGLRHVVDSIPGLRRRRAGRSVRHGKRWIADFAIQDADGRPIRDEAPLARIRQLAIPPAWTDVWICPDAKGHIQATGRDARGRKQYRYHPDWRKERDSTKYARMIEFGRSLPDLRRRMAADLRLPGLPRRKVLATVVKLLETTFIRVGNEEYARDNNSFGLTTLKNRHVDFRRAEVRFHFRGKSGIYQQVSVHDPSIARIVRRCRDLPGQELFQYVDDSGQPASTNSSDVNDYIREATGHDFTAKDFRTWAGTVLAAVTLDNMCVPAERTKSARSGRSARAARTSNGQRRPTSRNVVVAIQQVADRLRNTPAVCRKSYVHPYVIASFLDGTLASAFDRTPRTPRTPAPASRGSSSLRPEELAVMALLRRRGADEKKGVLLTRQLRRSIHAVRYPVRPRPLRRFLPARS
jgi:DNA topoisomerase-1